MPTLAASLTGGVLGAVGFIARCDLRQRWRRIVVLTLVVGTVGAIALSMAAGARRTSSALGRFQAHSRSADIELDGELTSRQLEALSRVPGVAAVATLRAFGLIVPAAPDFQAIGAQTGTGFGVVVDRDRIVAGRAPDPAAVDEITIGEGFANRLRVGVGDPLDVESYSPAQIAAILGGAPTAGGPAGPRVRLRIVGIVRRPLDLGERNASGGLLVLTPAFDRAYRDRIGIFGARIRIRTDRGSADVPGVLAASRRIFGESIFSAQALAVQSQGASNAIAVLALALWIGAGVTAFAGTVAIAILLSREISLVSIDRRSLRELGCTSRQRILVAALTAMLVAGGGALLAVLAAVGLSPLFPLGVARQADPSIGLHADWIVLVLGLVGVGAVVLAIALVAAYRATRRPSVGVFASGRARTSTIAERCAEAGVAPSTTNGLRMAFEPGRGTTAVPVRSAFVGAMLGVLGVTSALVFASSLDRLVATPRLYGSTWDVTAEDITSNTPCGAGDYGLGREVGIAALAELCSENVVIDGRPVAAIALTNLRGTAIKPEIIAGRAPRGTREIALGSKTLDALGKRIGDTVRVTGRRATLLEYRIVGRAVIPTLNEALPLADGATLTGAGFAPVFDQNLFNRYFVGRFAAGADRAAIEQRIDAIPQLAPASTPTVPVEVDRLQQIGWLPVTLAVLFAALALLAVGHALVTGVRRRRREFAIFKALGFSRRQVRATVACQATALGAVGLVVGVPAGLLVGALVWRGVTDGLGVAAAAVVPGVALVVTIVCAAALVNLVAFFPARAAAVTSAAVGLHSE